MSIRINNTVFNFNQNISLEDAFKRANDILAAIAMVRNPFDLMQVKVYNNNIWEVI